MAAGAAAAAAAAVGAPGGAAERVAAFSVDVVTLKKWNNFTERTRRRKRERERNRAGERALGPFGGFARARSFVDRPVAVGEPRASWAA